MLAKLKNVSWQAVTLLLGGGALAASTLLFAPPDVCAQLLSAQGFVTTVIGLFLQWEREKPVVGNLDISPTPQKKRTDADY
jgi:hypothetical protein